MRLMIINEDDTYCMTNVSNEHNIYQAFSLFSFDFTKVTPRKDSFIWCVADLESKKGTGKHTKVSLCLSSRSPTPAFVG